jgi:hypothetical protein
MLVPTEPSDTPPSSKPSVPETRRRLTRLAPLLLIAGAVAAASFVVPRVPHQHHVVLRLHAPETVTGVDLAWRPLPEGPGSTLPPQDATQGGSWHFAAGAAPATINTQVTLPDGRCELEVVVERGAAHEDLHRVVSFGDADDITVPLR